MSSLALTQTPTLGRWVGERDGGIEGWADGRGEEEEWGEGNCGGDRGNAVLGNTPTLFLLTSCVISYKCYDATCVVLLAPATMLSSLWSQ